MESSQKVSFPVTLLFTCGGVSSAICGRGLLTAFSLHTITVRPSTSRQGLTHQESPHEIYACFNINVCTDSEEKRKQVTLDITPFAHSVPPFVLTDVLSQLTCGIQRTYRHEPPDNAAYSLPYHVMPSEFRLGTIAVGGALGRRTGICPGQLIGT
jgi:hypothetical protein